MSAAFGLVKFNASGNIYYGCYEGTTDIMNPYLCTPEECYDKINDYYSAISYCRKLSSAGDWVFPNNVSDLDEVEIYSNYGGGFYWKGKGSESVKMIKYSLNPFEECYEDIQDGIPQWASDFLRE